VLKSFAKNELFLNSEIKKTNMKNCWKLQSCYSYHSRGLEWMALNKESDNIRKDIRVSNLPKDFRLKLPGVTVKYWNIWERFQLCQGSNLNSQVKNLKSKVH